MADQFSPGQIDLLLKLASKKLGTTPEALRAQLQGENADAFIQKIVQQNDALQRILSDPELTRQFLNSKEAQELMRKLKGENVGG